MHGLGGDPAEAVQERGRPGSAVVVVGAEQQDVALADLLAGRRDRGLDLRGSDIVAARVLADVDTDRIATEGVERHLADLLATSQVVPDGVDMRGGVVRGDDELGVERRPSLWRVRVHDVPKDLARREERMQLALSRERLREVDDASCHGVPPFPVI